MTLSSPIEFQKFLIIQKISTPCEWISIMRQLIAVTPDNSNRNAVESGSSRRWNNQAYGSINTGTDPLRFQSRGYGQPHQSHMMRFNERQHTHSSTVNLGSLYNRINIIFARPEIVKMSKGIDDNYSSNQRIRKMCVFQFGKNLSNVKISNNKCVSELRTYHGTYCKTLKNDKLMNYSNANHENNSNVKGNNSLDQIPDSPEADLGKYCLTQPWLLRTQYQNKLVSNGKI
ncbi:hypothetical protein TNCT_562541 [Trichonephila clavata]|uniref:Uncharacterized protein n=1 Tax=Trichonephila clavata TaxID=2740835 RepID=A0A8X6FQ70_TRICU|nr:hypothetical protein TNCT_562541 [Trichonephila clavata]